MDIDDDVDGESNNEEYKLEVVEGKNQIEIIEEEEVEIDIHMMNIGAMDGVYAVPEEDVEEVVQPDVT